MRPHTLRGKKEILVFAKVHWYHSVPNICVNAIRDISRISMSVLLINKSSSIYSSSQHAGST